MVVLVLLLFCICVCFNESSLYLIKVKAAGSFVTTGKSKEEAHSAGSTVAIALSNTFQKLLGEDDLSEGSSSGHVRGIKSILHEYIIFTE